jgi:hypothetical protein
MAAFVAWIAKGLRGARALGAAAALLSAPLPGGAARAADAADEARTVLFGSLDAGSANFLTVGGKYAPGGVDHEGFAAVASLGYGARFERDGNAPQVALGLRAPLAVRHTARASALGGYQWFYDWGVVALFAGPELAYEVFAAPSARRWPAPRFGARVQGEVWARPSDDTLVTATVIAGTARADVWARVSWGIRLPEFVPALLNPWLAQAYFGPEAALYADADPYRKWSLGLHATGFAVGDYSLRLSAGALYEEQVRRPGGYVSLAVWTRL